MSLLERRVDHHRALRDVAAAIEQAGDEQIARVAEAKGDDAEDRLRSYFAAELPAFMRPKRILWRDRLPVGPNGKLDRSRIQADAQEERA